MNRVKLAMLASTALCLGVGSADAAGVADPWVGFYVGGNLGYSWGSTNTTTTVLPFNPNNFVPFPGGASATWLKPDGFIGGGQAGYVGRLAPHWLAGVETDLQWSDERDSGHGVFASPSQLLFSCFVCSYNNTTDITARLSWFGTLRGRAGYDWNGLWFYGTGGLAYGQVSFSGVNTLTTFGAGSNVLASVATPFSYSPGIQVGWVAGFGIEGLIGDGRWRWKIEYLHIDLGLNSGDIPGTVPVALVSFGRFTDDILRIGFNYRITAGP
jgi:outer membrane immunogenic protein